MLSASVTQLMYALACYISPPNHGTPLNLFLFLCSLYVHSIRSNRSYCDDGVNSLRPSDAYTIIGSDNGLSPERRQANIWTNDGILLMEPWNLRNKLQWNFRRNSYIFIQENAFENIACETAAILSRPQCVKLNSPPQRYKIDLIQYSFSCLVMR